MENDFEDFIDELTNQDQPTCNIDNPDDCEACGSKMGKKNSRSRTNNPALFGLWCEVSPKSCYCEKSENPRFSCPESRYNRNNRK